MLGLGAGVLLAVLARAVETSRLAIGPYPFYGNGALIVPALGAGLALYGLWTWLLAYGRGRLDLLWSTIGLSFGLGAIGLLSTPPSLGAIPFVGLLFVAPAAVAAFAVLTALESRLTASGPGSRANPLLLTLLVVVGLLLAVAPFPPLGVGIITGAFIAVGRRAGSAGALTLGGLLFIVLLAAGLALPLLLMR